MKETILEPIKVFKTLTVYRRKPPEFPLPPFVVIREDDGRILEQFTTLKKAAKWAKENEEG